MKTYIISSHNDALLGMRLAGVEGTLVKTKEEAERILDEVLGKEEIQILVVDEKVYSLVEDRLLDIKINCKRPLIVEISTENGMTGSSHMTDIIKGSIGLKI
ncbi:MAG: ATP synthase subunit F [Clostridiales bacterium]|nr:ATP synthase subunit F [Clostridiales bacterium]